MLCEARPARLGLAAPAGSILHGLQPGELFASHDEGGHASGQWGWLCVAGDVVALRLAASPPCANGLPNVSGPYLVEYLGTAASVPVPEQVLAPLRKICAALLSSRPSVSKARVVEHAEISLLSLSRGRLSTFSHEPDPAHAMRVVSDGCTHRTRGLV
jgi:hypothetical protein